VRGADANYARQQIYFVSYPGGHMDAITRDTNNYSDLSLAANGQILATVLSEERWNLEVMPAAGNGADVRPVAAAQMFTNFTWTKDGRLLDDKDNLLNWVDPETGAKGVVATGQKPGNGDPWQCADGNYIVFLHGLQGGEASINVWRTDSSGGNLKQLTQDKSDNFTVCAPDSKSVFYLQGGTGYVMQVPINGGTPRQVSDLNVAGYFDISPDNRTLAFATVDHAAGHEERLALVSVDSGKLEKKIEFQRTRTGLVHFSRDGKSIVYPIRENNADNLWQQPLDGSPGRQLTSFKSEHIWDYHWSPDGTKLALVRGHTDSDVVLIRSQQP